jgi:hypothetical protein
MIGSFQLVTDSPFWAICSSAMIVSNLLGSSGALAHLGDLERDTRPHYGRFWGQADINWQANPAASVENDPFRTCGQAGRLRETRVRFQGNS